MNPSPQRAPLGTDPLSSAADILPPLELGREDIVIEPMFDPDQWAEDQAEARGSGGRQVLGTALVLLGALWLAYTAWSAGRALANEPLTPPPFAPRVALAARPLGLLRLVWVMFCRTRRQETERITPSVLRMRSGT